MFGVESEENIGSTFWFTLPTNKHHSGIYEDNIAFKQASVLIFDPHVTTREALRLQLQAWGVNVTDVVTRGVTFNTVLRGTSRSAFTQQPRMYGVTVRTKF